MNKWMLVPVVVWVLYGVFRLITRYYCISPDIYQFVRYLYQCIFTFSTSIAIIVSMKAKRKQ